MKIAQGFLHMLFELCSGKGFYYIDWIVLNIGKVVKWKRCFQLYKARRILFKEKQVILFVYEKRRRPKIFVIYFYQKNWRKFVL